MKKTLLFLLAFTISLSTFSQTVWAPIAEIDDDVSVDPYAIASADLDGDTHVDIVLGTYNFSDDYIRWYKNDGNADPTFTEQTVISNSAGLQGIGGLAIADLDGINGNDVVAGSYSGKVVWFANDGMGGFGSEQLIGNLLGAGLVTVADINNDGNLDVASVGFDADKAVWYAGDGAGNFGSEQIIANITEPGNLSFVDFDGDTDLDAVVGYNDTTTSGTIEIYYNQYIESGTMTVSWVKDAVTVDSGNPFLFVSKFADVDDDGTMEIIKSDNVSGDVSYYNKIKNGSSTEVPISDDSIIDRPAVVAVADMDNDTYNDVVLTDGGSIDDALIWFESTDVGGFNMEALIADHNYQLFAITINDLDGDGDKDIASVGWFSHTLDWYENELETLSTSDFSINQLKIYPNPTPDYLHLEGLTESKTIVINDVLGKEILNRELQPNDIVDLSQLYSGIYILKIEGYSDTFKVIKR